MYLHVHVLLPQDPWNSVRKLEKAHEAAHAVQGSGERQVINAKKVNAIVLVVQERYHEDFKNKGG